MNGKGILLCMLVLSVTAITLCQRLSVAEESDPLSLRKGEIFPDENFDDVVPEGNVTPANWELSDRINGTPGDCIPKMSRITLDLDGTCMRLWAKPEDVEKSERTAFMLIHGVDKRAIPDYVRICYSVTIKIDRNGIDANGVNAIVGLIDDRSLKAFELDTIKEPPPLCVVFHPDGSMCFQDYLETYNVNEWYKIMVVLSPSGNWELWIGNNRRGNGTLSEIQEGSQEFPEDMFSHFCLGFDGWNQSFLIKEVKLFYLGLDVPLPFWSRLEFWQMLSVITLGMAILGGFLHFRSRSAPRNTANQELTTTDKRPVYLTCKNPDCGFSEVPPDSAFCPNCGKSIDE